MDGVALTLRAVQSALSAWDLGNGISVRPYGRGMNSRTWLVTTSAGTWVAKAVSATTARQFEAGLVAATFLEAAGLRAGAPLRTRAGELSVAVKDDRMAVLRFVPGRELDASAPMERWLWGFTLGRAHRILHSRPPPDGLGQWHWVDPTAPHLDVEPWTRESVASAVEALGALQGQAPLTMGVLHGDPAPEAFLVDDTGEIALIDWNAATWGPLLYDVASARMYSGSAKRFAPVLDGYLAAMPLPPDEVAALPMILRFRWAVQADYFARRLWNNDLTGISGPEENAEGLADARLFLLGCR